MNKLELKHIALYLPYDIKIIWNDSKELYSIYFDENIDWDNKKYPLSTLIYTLEKQDVDSMGWSLLLRPLSDLTKEIEHNGERFVPIVELSKMDSECGKCDMTVNEYGNCIGRLNAGVVVCFQIDEEIPFVKEIHNNIFGEVSGNDFDDMHLSSLLPSEIRYKLLEWHFDIFDLRSKDLCVYYNEI